MTDALIDSERDKYERIFKFANYGEKGHAVPHAHFLIDRAPRGSVVADFGCGRGGSFPPFLAAGYRIVPVDHISALAPEWLNHKAVDPLWKTNLWQGPLPVCDYGILSLIHI